MTSQDTLSFYLDKANPDVWKAFGGFSTQISQALAAADVDDQLKELVSVRISQINKCSYCLNLHVRRAEKAGVSSQRLAVLPGWRDAQYLYSDQETAALALAEAVTELGSLDDLQAAQLLARGFLTDEQFAAIHWLAIVMNAANRVSISSHHQVPAAR